MFAVLANTSIAARVTAASAIPMICFLYVAASDVWRAAVQRQEALQLSEVCDTMPLVLALVDSLQRERGLSVRAFSVQTEAAYRKVAAQRDATDLAFDTLQQKVRALDDQTVGAELLSALRRGIEVNAALGEVRQELDRRALGLPDLLAKYNGIIGGTSTVIYRVAAILSHSGAVRQLIGLAALAESKNRAGLERAFGTRGFSTPQFQVEDYENFVRFRGEQEGYLAVAESLAVGPARETLAGLPNTNEAKAVVDMRGLARDALGSPLSRPETAMQWFDIASERIALFAKAQLQIAEQVDRDAGLSLATANSRLRNVAILIAVTAAIVAAALTTVIRSIIMPITELVSDAGRLAAGDTSVKFEAAARRDEIGIVARAVEKFRDNVKRQERMKNEFIATVSHELRTPLTAILGAIGFLAGGKGDTLPAPIRRLVTIAQTNCERLVRIVNDILDIDKIDSGSMSFQRKLVEVRRLVQRAIEASQPFADESGIGAKLDDRAVEAILMAEPDRLSQVVGNLLSNAIKFSPRGSQIICNVERVDDAIHITVRDHGKGIPEAYRNWIFEKFVQVEASDQREKGGAGLGLSIAKRIVTKLGGTIDFEPAPGGGTIFRVILPEWNGLGDHRSNTDRDPTAPPLRRPNPGGLSRQSA